MPVVADLQGPVGYSPVWTVLAVAAAAATLLYFAVVLWWTRAPRPDRPETPSRVRRRHLREIDAISQAVSARRLDPIAGHQRLSATVRRFVQSTTDLPAEAMTLDALRGIGPEPLTRLLEDLYPPAFAGDEDVAAERFAEAARDAREVVASWS